MKDIRTALGVINEELNDLNRLYEEQADHFKNGHLNASTFRTIAASLNDHIEALEKTEQMLMSRLEMAQLEDQ